MSGRFPILASLLLVVSGALSGRFLASQVSHVGDSSRLGVLVNTGSWIKPAGKFTQLSSRPTSLVRIPGKSQFIVRTLVGLALVDIDSLKILSQVEIPNGSSLNGLAVTSDGTRVLTGNSQSSLWITELGDGKLGRSEFLKLPATSVTGESYPAGIAILPGDNEALVALNRDNSVVRVDLTTKAIKARIPVQVAPYDVLLMPNGSQAWVSCWSRKAQPSAEVADSSGTKVAVDPRGIGNGGVLCRIDLANQKIDKEVSVGSQPTQLLLHEGLVWCTIAASDELVAVNPGSATLQRRANLNVSGSIGSAPGALAVDPKSNSLLISLGGENVVVRYSLEKHGITGEVATGWYPAGILVTPSHTIIASTKGIGSRSPQKDRKSHGVYDFTGLVSQVHSTDFKPFASRPAMMAAARKGVGPKPLPDRVGEPSPIKHVVYVIKENRTYDQVFGDVPSGNGDAALAVFGEQVTPNHHALAKEFVLLDNFYCNGVLSADGHAWATEGNATLYYEHSFGGWTRSYPFGDDPLATSSTGYIWDNVISHGRSFKNFGEFDYAAPNPARSYASLLQNTLAGKPEPTYKHNIGVKRLRELSHPGYPGWNMAIPDISRAAVFVADLKKANQLADFTIVYLPQDHTSGSGAGAPTPRAHLADNDLALGRVVEAITQSKFWKSTSIFVVEDDAQDGFDHIDGHRSPCLVISPFTRRGAVVSRFYNQTSVLRTIEHILGLPPMNRMDANAPLMSDCFTSQPNLKPYRARPAKIDLTEVNGKSKSLARINLSRPDDADEEELNAQIWSSVKGDAPYPSSRFNKSANR